ncbi:RNA methyltransferase [Candidatus Methanomassiliicoccus intestinalis]
MPPVIMAAYRVVLVSPLYDGNVGAIARAMANFGLSELVMVNPCELTDEAFRRAKHAQYILENASIVSDFETAVSGCDLVVGTSGIVTSGQKNFTRIPESARGFADKMKSYTGKVALVFGPEDDGLSQHDLEHCDILVHIPSSDSYPVLNLSHAVSIITYEVFLAGNFEHNLSEATDEDKERLFEFFNCLLDSVNYPEFRKENTSTMFRRIIGRAVLTKWEFCTLVGVIADAHRIIEGKKPLPP